MFIYTESHNESYRNTQNINIQHETHQQHQITFSKFTFICKHPFSKLDKNKTAFYAKCYGTISILLNQYNISFLGEVGERGGSPQIFDPSFCKGSAAKVPLPCCRARANSRSRRTRLSLSFSRKSNCSGVTQPCPHGRLIDLLDV